MSAVADPSARSNRTAAEPAVRWGERGMAEGAGEGFDAPARMAFAGIGVEDSAAESLDARPNRGWLPESHPIKRRGRECDRLVRWSGNRPGLTADHVPSYGAGCWEYADRMVRG